MYHIAIVICVRNCLTRWWINLTNAINNICAANLTPIRVECPTNWGPAARDRARVPYWMPLRATAQSKVAVYSCECVCLISSRSRQSAGFKAVASITAVFVCRQTPHIYIRTCTQVSIVLVFAFMCCSMWCLLVLQVVRLHFYCRHPPTSTSAVVVSYQSHTMQNADTRTTLTHESGRRNDTQIDRWLSPIHTQAGGSQTTVAYILALKHFVLEN